MRDGSREAAPRGIICAVNKCFFQGEMHEHKSQLTPLLSQTDDVIPDVVSQKTRTRESMRHRHRLQGSEQLRRALYTSDLKAQNGNSLIGPPSSIADVNGCCPVIYKLRDSLIKREKQGTGAS